MYVGYERTNCVETAQGFVQTVDAQDHVLVECVCYDRTNRVATAQGCVRTFEGDASDDDKDRDVCTVLAIVGSSASVGAASPGGLHTRPKPYREQCDTGHI